MTRLSLSIAVLLAVFPLAGCFGGGSDTFDFVPGTKYKETGNEIHLKATVRDYDATPYDGLNTYLWAFCFAPVDPTDMRSANAIEGWTMMEGEGPVDAPAGEKCGVPGPTLRVKQGDKVIVEFAHSHFHPHTIHWHGQFVDYLHDGAPGSSQQAVTSGGAYKYEFIAKRAGTLWYHCHVDTQTHVMQGLYGVMIVEPQDETYEPKGIDKEYVLVLSTMNRNMVEAFGSRHAHPPGCASGFFEFNGVPCENPVSKAGEPDVFLINGHSYPRTMDQKETLMTVKEGERIRVRVLNAGETVEQLHLHGHDMLVTHKDGNPLAKSARYWADTINIGPAERYDFVVEADNPGPWMIHTHVSAHETNCGKAPGGMHTMLVYEEYLTKMHEFKAELPVDCPQGEVLELPSDYTNQTNIAVSALTTPVGPLPGGAQPAATATWGFPVQLACGVRSVELYGQFVQQSAAGTTNLQVAVKRPDGAAANNGTFTLTSPGNLQFGYVLKEKALTDLKTGNYTVEVTGYGQGNLAMSLRVDYYETFEQSKIGHLKFGKEGCPGFT